MDFTKRRKGSRSELGRIDYCPKCGKKGAVRQYKNGERLIVHQSRTYAIGRMQGQNLTDSCMIPTTT